ncbi:MAG: PKD domain-containing protein, partial [Patescibacteria group bacterium]|nr:PKD domain-containing protein [Patescibacteria group bacterium]
MKNFNKGFVVPAVIAVIATLIIGSGIYVYEKNKQPSPAGQSGTPDTSLANTNGWKTYNNAAYNYSIKYPANWYINTTYSNQDFTPRGPSPSTYIGGDTSISNYSDTYMDEYHAKNGDLAQPADYFLISLSFTKIEVTNNGSMGTYKENADPYAFLGNYLSKFGKPNTTDNIMLNGTSAVRNTYLNITGIGGNTKPNRVSVNLRRGNEIIGIGYGFDDSVKSLVPIADQIVNSLTLGNNAQASGVLFSASPTSGVAPLTVTFTGTIDTKIYGNGPFTVDFGDGQQKSFPILGLVNEARSDVASIQPTTHIYNNPGNYVAKLAKNNCSLPTSGRLQQPTCKPGDMINTANINVGKNNSVTPSVTVSSPNGGEDWSVGSTNAISWSSNAGNLVSPNVVLSLSDSSGHNILQIAPSVPLTGSYEWSIPSSVVPGQYKVSAYLSGVGARGGGAVQDYSDSYFTISPTVSASPNPASSRGITINSSSQPSGQVGTQLKLNVSFSNEIYRGPEYATQVVLKRSSGETAIVDTMADFNTVTFSIQNNMCGVSLGGRGGQ